MTCFFRTALCAAALVCAQAHAAEPVTPPDHNGHMGHSGHMMPGESMTHQRMGKVMISLGVMQMGMDTLMQGDREVSNAEAVTLPNRFFGEPMNAPTYRVIPEEMTGRMTMLGLGYHAAPGLMVMGMVPYVEREMEMTVFQGMTGATPLARTKMDVQGLGDIRIAARKTMPLAGGKLSAGLGLSLPTGSIDEEGTMLMPNGMFATRRLAYTMQLGTGTVDLLPELGYESKLGPVRVGAKYEGRLHLGRNSEGYSRGDRHTGTLWAGYDWTPAFETRLSLSAIHESEIDGRDPLITGAMPGMDPLNYGFDAVDAGLSARLYGDFWGRPKDRIELGGSIPIHERVNGLRLGRSYAASVRYVAGF